MTNAELIKALRRCGDEPYDITKPCKVSPWKLMCDAADALEAAEQRIAELERILKAVQENSGINFRLWQEAEAQLPKEGEWMTNIKWYYQPPTQIVATTDGTTFMCRSTGELCKNATEYGYCKQTVCNNSGALCIYDCRGMCIKHSDVVVFDKEGEQK